jgi:WD40 repeat protein/serine/threonine protein kinase
MGVSMSASWFCLCGQRWSTETNPDSSDSLPPCPACGEPAAGELAEEDPSSLETTDIPVVSPLPSESNPPAEVTEEILDALPVEPGSAPASEGPTIVVPPQQGEAGGNAARGEAPLRLMPDLPLRNPGSQTRDVEASKPPTPASESATLPPGEALSRSGTQRVWPNVPGYELLEEVGRGGMGVVFKARQVRLDRIVALKMILAGAHAGTQEIARFRTEAEAVARLDHPHIVQIYAIGEHAGRPFLALEFVEGGSLEEVISRGAEAPTLGEDPAGGDSQPPRKQARPLTPIKAAELLAKIAGAIHVAHRRGIIHRDLKPANILLTEEGEPKIADFGLAKQLDAQTRTQTGAVVGTPSYMAPEQAGGKKKEIGPHTDVYALGAILYECLTGRPPFKAETPLDTILQVVSEECRPPSQINPRVPRDLETICLKCLRKSPRERYFSARALAVDCSAFARGEPIQARRSSFLERSARWVWKHPLLTATTCLLFFVLLGLGLWYADDLNRIIHNEGRLVVNSEVTDVKEGRLLLKRGENVVRQWHLHSYRFRSIPAGTYQVEAESPTVALEVEPSEITITRNGQVTVRVFPGSVRSLGRLSGHTGVVRGLALSPDGRWALSASPSFPVGDETLRLWDVAGRKMIQQFEEVQGGICAVAFGPEGKRVLAGGEDGKVHLWHLEPGDSPASPPRPGLHKVLLGHSGAVHTVAFSADGQRAASAGKDRLIRIWNLRTLEMEQVLKGHSDTVTRVLFVPGQHRILSGSRDHSLRLWDLKTGRQVGWFPPHPGMVLGVACSPSGDRAITGCEDGKVRLWEIPLSDNQGQGGMGGRQRPPRCNEGRLLRVFPGHTHAVTWVAYAPDGKQIFSASLDRTVRIWEPKSGKHQASLTGHGDGVLSLAFCPRTRQMLSAGGVNDIAGWNIGQDFNLHLWQVPGPLTIEQEYPETFNQPLATLPGHTSEVRGVGFVPGEHKLLSSGYDGQPRLWDLDTGKIEQSFASPAGRILVQAISPDGKLALTGSVENQLCLWDLDKGALRQSYPGHTGQVCGVDFSPDLNLVLSGGGYDRTAWLRERKTGKVLQRYIGHLSPVEQARFSPDGKQVATCSHDGTIKIWDRDTGKELRTLIGHTSQVWSIAYFPGGKRLASGSHDGTVRIWEVATGKQLRRFEGHRGIVYSVAVSPDGTCLLSAGSDRLVRLWSVSTGKMLAVLAGHSREIFQVAFSPGGNFAASASKDQTIHLWQLPEVTEPAETEISEPEKGLLLVKSDDPTVRVLVRKSNQPYTLLAPAIHGAYPLEPGSYTFELQGEQRSRKLSATGLTILAGNKYVLDLVHNPQFVGVLWEKTPEGPGRFCRLAVCPDGEHFLVTRSGGVVELRNLGSGSIVQSGFTPKGLDSKAKGRAAHPGAEGRSGNALGPKAGATPPDPQSAIRNPQSAIEGLSTLDIWGLALSQDGKQALTSSQDGTLQLWELGQHPEGMRPVRTYTAFSRDPHAVAFLPDGEHALANGPGHSIVLWSLETGQPIRTFTGHTGTVVRLVCSRDGETFFSASGDGTVRQWHLETGKEVRRFLDHTGRVEALAVSPDGTRLASGGLDHTIRIWDSGTGKVLRRLVGHRDWVLSLAFSPDGSRLLSSGQDGSVRFWDVEEGKELRRYVSRSGGAEAVAFCRDGTLALSAQPERLALAQLPLYRPGLQGPISDSPGQIVFEPDHTGLSVQMMSSTGLKRATCEVIDKRSPRRCLLGPCSTCRPGPTS